MSKVATVNTRNIMGIPTPEKRDITQKYESLACETIIEPAPIANTVNTLAASLSNPKEGNIGNTIVAVVIIATEDDPCAVFRIAASRKGNIKPIPLIALSPD